jgi:hypothetical protein
MSEALPAALSELHEAAKAAGDRTTTFRAYVKLLNAAYKALEKAREEARLADRHLNGLRVDHSFFQRHKGRVEAAFRLLRETYRNPAKALRTIDELAANYPVQYVYDVCQLGSYRLGAPLGWNVLGIRSAERIDAEQNYVDAVIPSLVELLPDHAAYLELRSKDIEQQFEEALSDANRKRAIHAAIETVVPTWNDELAACALSLTDAQVAGLSESEREVRRRLLPVPKVDEEA